MTDIDATGQICIYCDQVIQADERGTMMIVVDDCGTHRQAAHPECRALGIIGHDFGVCGCTGWKADRAAALELRRRLIEFRERDR